MNIAAGNVVTKVSTISGRIDLAGGFFYTVANDGTVSLWFTDGDCAYDGDPEAIQLGARHPGTSGKDAATIARDMLNGA